MYKKVVGFFPGNRKSYLQNAIFDREKKDEWSPIFIKLKEYLNQNEIDISTYDIPLKKPAFRYVYIDLPYLWTLDNFPVWKMIFLNREKNILIAHETPSVIPYNYMKIFHFFFKKVYTWNDDLIDNDKHFLSCKKYFKLYVPKYSIGLDTSLKDFKNKKFLVLINSNKLPLFPFQILSPFGKELFSERIKAIEFFEKKIPDQFSLYGRGWNKPKKYNLRELIFGFKKYATYKGEVGIDDKIELLSNFKYCICFENLANVKGYITEKIFDCFKAKCIPIYWGATNIDKYIPRNCYIDFRDFECNYEKLLNFLVSIDETGYNHYIINIKKFLSNKKLFDLWFEEGFAKFFLQDILEIKVDN